MRIRQSLLQLYIPETGMLIPWKVQRLGAGSWEFSWKLGLWSNARVRAAVDCGEMD